MRVFLRLAAVAAVAIAVGASASSSQQQPAVGTYTTAGAPPPSSPMDPAAALGLWKSSFGPVKIELDREAGDAAGGATDVHLMGVWVYERDGQEVIGFFSGPLEGNVLHLDWEEPSEGEPLRGSGYLVFETTGGSFSGRWWTESRDRGGEWTGWRPGAADPAADPGAFPAEPGYDPDADDPAGSDYEPDADYPAEPGYDPDAPPAEPGYDDGY